MRIVELPEAAKEKAENSRDGIGKVRAGNWRAEAMLYGNNDVEISVWRRATRMLTVLWDHKYDEYKVLHVRYNHGDYWGLHAVGELLRRLGWRDNGH